MSQEQFTLGQLKKKGLIEEFSTSYNDLLLSNNDSLNDDNLRYLLKTSIVMLNYGDLHLQRLGYRIVLRYGILTGQYKPLYDVSINKGFIPVSKQIEDKYFFQEDIDRSFFKTYFSAYHENFKDNDIYLSFGQKKLITLSNTTKNNIVVVAPTSYGKSEIIIKKISQNLSKKICVIVPSKALLAQTKKRILSSSIAKDIGRIITHSEMYRGDEKKFVAVLTQERLLRLLQRNTNLKFDFIFVDEAHNIFKKDNRAILLAQVIMILKKRNNGLILNFFSPFISDHKKLRIPYSNYQIEGIGTSESIKVEKYFYCDTRGDGKLFLYDQFLNNSLKADKNIFNNEVDLIKEYCAKKNIIYLNKQRDIQSFALSLTNEITKRKNTIIDDVVATIADFLHPDYHLLKCLKAGVVYHHGGMPEIIRLYVEEVFTKNPNLQFIVTNSTLLEGVNIPAEKIFLLTNKIGNKNFSKSEFKNLIGRICRFSEVFHKEHGSMALLEPEIYLIKSIYSHSKSNLVKFYETVAKVDIKIDDEVENILLKEKQEIISKEDKDKLKSHLEYLENIEPNTVSVDGITYVDSEIAKLCFKNNVYDFDIKSSEKQLVKNLRQIGAINQISNPNDLMDLIDKLFLRDIEITNKNIIRLNNQAARKFYSMVLDWRSSGTSYKEMIANFMGYWNGLKDKVVYFGRAWGELSRDEDAFIPTYIDLGPKSSSERINLAIIKIKEEQDFLEFNLLKYIDILNDLELIDPDFFDRIKYGSSDKEVIILLKNGFSIELAKCIIDHYRQYLNINNKTDEIVIASNILAAMEENGENKILIFEIIYHIRQSI